MKGFKNASIYVEGQGIVKTSLTIGADGRIAAIGTEVPNELFDVPEDAVVVPGFIDEHIHGSATADAMDGTVEALKTISQSIACEGTVGFLATTMTQSPENIEKAMRAVKTFKEEKACGAKVLGIHLEGPYINKSKAGAQPEKYICAPSIEQFKHYNELSGNSIKIVTFAPEMDGSKEFAGYLKQNGICGNVGHTSANFATAEQALEWGATGITHTYNAQSAYTHREVGVVGAALLLDGYACEIICDTIHVSVPAIKMLIKNKPHDKVILITDAMRAKNLGDTVSELGGQTVYVKNGEARLADGTLAGSVLRMNDAVKNLVNKCGVDLCDAVDFASANPAKNLGLFNDYGSIAVGKSASFAVLSKDCEVIMTVRDGEVIYKA